MASESLLKFFAVGEIHHVERIGLVIALDLVLADFAQDVVAVFLLKLIDALDVVRMKGGIHPDGRSMVAPIVAHLWLEVFDMSANDARNKVSGGSIA